MNPSQTANVLVLVVDGLRPDSISASPDKRQLRKHGVADLPQTPTLDRLYREGVRFNQCISVSTRGTPSHTTSLTGLLPVHHGVRRHRLDRLSAGTETLFDRFKKAGFTCLTNLDFITNFTEVGLTRSADFVTGGSREFSLIGRMESCRRAGKPVFGYLHFGSLAWPYGVRICSDDTSQHEVYIDAYLELAKRVGFDTSSAERNPGLNRRNVVHTFRMLREHLQHQGRMVELALPLYLAAVNRFDSTRLSGLISRLDAVGLLEDTWIVIMGSHSEAAVSGEMQPVGPDGHPTKPTFGAVDTVNEDALKVPWIVWRKNWNRSIEPEERRVSDLPVSTADLAPTVLGILGLKPSASRLPPESGRDRSAFVLRGEPDQRASLCFAEAWAHSAAYWDLLDRREKLDDAIQRGFDGKADSIPPIPKLARIHQQTLREGRWKLILTSGRPIALFDVESDPSERCNLLAQSPAMPTPLQPGEPPVPAALRGLGPSHATILKAHSQQAAALFARLNKLDPSSSRVLAMGSRAVSSANTKERRVRKK